ncbi:MAG: glycohydrolase toxin TNT-related protein [Tyzzerella sp.]|nr:glycohydrolase toxin TNT-related protein [Tyzzerella sp.]
MKEISFRDGKGDDIHDTEVPFSMYDSQQDDVALHETPYVFSDNISIKYPPDRGFELDLTQQILFELRQKKQLSAEADEIEDALCKNTDDDIGRSDSFPIDVALDERETIERIIDDLYTDEQTILPGTILVRYGTTDGEFLTVAGTSPDRLALPDQTVREKHTFMVLREFNARIGTVADWNEMKGGMPQIDLGKGRSINDMLLGPHPFFQELDECDDS